MSRKPRTVYTDMAMREVVRLSLEGRRQFEIADELGINRRSLEQEMCRRGMSGGERVAAIATYAIANDIVELDSELGQSLEQWAIRHLRKLLAKVEAERRTA